MSPIFHRLAKALANLGKGPVELEVEAYHAGALELHRAQRSMLIEGEDTSGDSGMREAARRAVLKLREDRPDERRAREILVRIANEG